MADDDIIRKVVNLRALADHPNTGPEEAGAARGLADRLAAKHQLDEADLAPIADEERSGFFGLHLDDECIRNNRRFDRLQKAAQDAVNQLVVFLHSEAGQYHRRPFALEQLTKQIHVANDQMRECHMCHRNGFDGPWADEGEKPSRHVTRHFAGTDRRDRNLYEWFHAECWEHWLEMLAGQGYDVEAHRRRDRAFVGKG